MNINDPKFHKFYQHRSTSLEWLDTDSQEKFDYNLKNNFDKLEKYGWLTTPVSYTFNSCGFRSVEFTNDDSIVFLGCSVTMGIGLPLDKIFPINVSNSLKLKCFNLAISGSSSDTSFRLALHYLEKLRPKIVVLSVFFPARMEVLDIDKAIHLLPRYGVPPKLYNTWLSTEENIYLNEMKNMMAIKHLCQHFNIKFVYITHSDEILDAVKIPSKGFPSPNLIDKITEHNLARDLIHPGVGFHSDVCNRILNDIAAK